MRLIWRVAAVLALGAGAAGLWFVKGRNSADDAAFEVAPPEVIATRVTAREIDETLEALGTTSSWEAVELRPTVTEFVDEIHFHDGQTVAAGDRLVTLVRREELARLGEASAFLNEQLREVKRIEGLVESRSLSRNQLDERRTLVEIARQRVAVAEAAVADREIRAPFAGVLGLRQVSPGALVTPETVITTLDDIAQLRLDFPVPSLHLADLREGAAVQATTPALPDRRFAGTVIGIDSRVNPVDRSVLVRARLANEELLLKPGLLLNVDVRQDTRRALMIPEEAVIHYQREHFVLWIDVADANRLERRAVEIGTREPGAVEIRDGLAAGDLIVAEGLAAARPGQQVVVREVREPGSST